MNILNILDEIEKVDGEIYERLNPRRKAMQDFFNVGKKISMAALPLALGSMFKKAYGQTNPANVNEVLGFALALEYLEYNYYNHALTLATTTYIPDGPARQAITTIRNHERAHVDLLKGALGITGADQYVYADFDFKAGGAFADVDTNYQTFLKVATAFEDTGVRAYKGQAPVLKGMPVLTTALQIHSVEARHAAHLRQMVAANVTGASALKPWIAYTANGNDTGVTAADAVYAGEQNTTQANIQITGINGTAVTQSQAAESFDEFLTGSDVKKIANLFIVPAKRLT
ncbi:ferritin-like domain-containing protein [Pedobacter sandarakinus]|uniref:ferritin-like domain-containing protein n=1 Tax=Pedobacter sandarakinus TaxID=353156 RepID=UPI0022484729|nr:ferritin-like domain-containing protein [Pedobacter sandarakinus]MCX2575223.1 ferritin-like domain-containing protein [Pedobacter sandarakinus]